MGQRGPYPRSLQRPRLLLEKELQPGRVAVGWCGLGRSEAQAPCPAAACFSWNHLATWQEEPDDARELCLGSLRCLLITGTKLDLEDIWTSFSWDLEGLCRGLWWKGSTQGSQSSQPGPTCLLLTVPSPQGAAEGISVDDHALTRGTQSQVCVGGLHGWGVAGEPLWRCTKWRLPKPSITCSSLPGQLGVMSIVGLQVCKGLVFWRPLGLLSCWEILEACGQEPQEDRVCHELRLPWCKARDHVRKPASPSG